MVELTTSSISSVRLRPFSHLHLQRHRKETPQPPSHLLAPIRGRIGDSSQAMALSSSLRPSGPSRVFVAAYASHSTPSWCSLATAWLPRTGDLPAYENGVDALRFFDRDDASIEFDSCFLARESTSG
jgi:hypothetical protein